VNGNEQRCCAPALGEYSRALRSAARDQAVADAEREVGTAWAGELLRLREAARDDIAAARALIEVIAEELDLIADAADEREKAVWAGRRRVASAREAACRGGAP